MVDLRKDKRAPASLKVKYKSVTVDQFIDQFGTDVSRGGIFVKTKKPIEIGALLKLELQLNDASPVIHGIGRVCWRREPGLDPNASAPAGMGIKFIKLDPESRTIVERIVNHRGDRPSRFEQTEGAEIAPPSISPPPASGAPPPITIPPPSPAAAASPIRAAAPIAAKPASPALQPPPAAIANKIPARAAVPTSPSVSGTASALRGGASLPTPAIAAPRAPAAPKPFAPAPAPAAKAEPSKPVTTGSRAVAGLFADSPLSRTHSTEPGAELRTRSSFFPPGPSNGSGSLSRPSSSRPTSGRSEQARQSGQFLATAFAEGGLAADTTEQARAAAEAGTDELLDELFDEVVKTSEHPAPPPLASQSTRPAASSESLSPVGAARVSQPSPMRESVDDMFAELSEEEGLSASSPALQTRKPASAPHSFPSAPLSARASARTPASLSSARTPAASAFESAPVRAAMPEPDFDDDERTTQRSSVDDLLDGLDEEAAATDEAATDEQFGVQDDGFGEADLFAGGARPAPESNAPSDPPVPRILSSAPVGPPELMNARGSGATPFMIILLVLAAAGGGFYFYQANQAAQRQAAAPAPVEAAPAPSAAPVVVEPSAANPAQPEQAPAAAAAAVPTDPGAAPAAAAPTPSPAHADAPSAPARSIDVEVSSVPRDANITVDGKPVGNTPAHVALIVDKATEVKVSTAGYAAMVRTLVPSLNNEPLRFKLEPLPYTLIVRSTPPSAQLAVGEHVALAPAPLDLGHLDGGVQVSISKDGYQRMTRLVRLDEFSEQGGVMRAEIEVTLGALPGGDAQHARPRPRPRTAADAPPAPTPSEPETSAPAAPSDHAAAPEAAPAPAAKPAAAEPPPATPAPAAE